MLNSFQHLLIYIYNNKILNKTKTTQFHSLFFSFFRMTIFVQHDTYTCHCEKIEDFRGNPKNTCVALDYFVTTFLVMTVIFYTLP